MLKRLRMTSMISHVNLVDDEGNEGTFIIDEAFEANGNDYAILVIPDELKENDEEDGFLFRVECNGDDVEYIIPEQEEALDAMATLDALYGEDTRPN